MKETSSPANQQTSKLLFVGLFGILGLFGLLPAQASAYAPLQLRYKHFIFKIDPDAHKDWRTVEEVWTYQGREIAPLATYRVDGDRIPPLPSGVIRSERPGWNRANIAATLEKEIGSKLSRKPQDVTIRKNATGSIVFDGVGMPGRTLLSEEAATLVTAALERSITNIELPVEETQPRVKVSDPELRKLGIKEIVTVGESVFTGSPLPRRHNIAVGLSKFNGHLIPQGTTFSFDKVLGRVDASTGYWKELVIMGEHTLPDYGGGLCQVSTTAYRGVWERGFPIVQRKNHSFVVSYYAPQGTDATIYPPNIDMQFVNDGPSALLIQTHDEGDHAYFIYYGTRDARTTDVIGPYLWDFRDAPPDREEFTTEIPPGEKRKASDRHPGMKAQWYRLVQTPEKERTLETIYSFYEARGLLTQIGAEPEGLLMPGWIGAEEKPTRNDQ